MTDKAREAFEKWADHGGPRLDLTWHNLPNGRGWCYRYPDVQLAWEAWREGYQAAHDAAMAAEPDADAMISSLIDTGDTIAAEIMRSLLLQLQAAQQREAECRKDAERYRWLRDTDGPLYIVNGNSALEPDEADAYIDAALATQPASPTPDSD